MKHKIIVVLCAIAIAVTAIACTKAYEHYQVQERAQAAVQAAEKKQHDTLQQAAVTAEKRRLADECTKETTYYNTLTPAQKVGKVAPACNLPQVQ